MFEEVQKIRISRYNGIPLSERELPDFDVRGLLHAKSPDLIDLFEMLRKWAAQAVGQVLIEQQLHAA